MWVSVRCVCNMSFWAVHLLFWAVASDTFPLKWSTSSSSGSVLLCGEEVGILARGEGPFVVEGLDDEYCFGQQVQDRNML